ncbi:uncharacterized protein LOC126738542 isoform X2 [Anthonomus grandis grandis]|uniref:uncharacterized protein LOC126738542 isoform X2 n=1 Tax=Anthonomus grandis grandis TaxID=2921223 RepID=UPI002164FA25|nr:uncharacterized protein LOC126738542 isoform X2 [Anthonomus grandis grandis]
MLLMINRSIIFGMSLMQLIFILYGLANQLIGAALPKAESQIEISKSASIGVPPLLTFKNGNIGVNFLGFKASAGLGGLLIGDMSHGGLHAEAETPFGQRADAGLGGKVDGHGRSVGVLYSKATAGGKVGAVAGLYGTVDANESARRSYADASAYGVGKTFKERVGSPAVATRGLAKPESTKKIEMVKEVSSATSKINIEIQQEEGVAPPLSIKKTHIERTWTSDFIGKTIQVPSYVEKTIKVPTIVEKKMKVSTPPSIIEKEVNIPQHVIKTQQIVKEHNIPDTPTVPIARTKTVISRRPWLNLRKRIDEKPYYGDVVANADSSRNIAASSGFGYESAYKPVPPVTYTTTARKQFNGNLIKDILTIPIATLEAVGNLFGNFAEENHGSVSVSKLYSF